MIIEAGCIGRDREVGEILERAAQLTQTSYLLVTGAAGIGKSTLLRHVAQLAPQQDLSIRTIDDATISTQRNSPRSSVRMTTRTSSFSPPRMKRRH